MQSRADTGRVIVGCRPQQRVAAGRRRQLVQSWFTAAMTCCCCTLVGVTSCCQPLRCVLLQGSLLALGTGLPPAGAASMGPDPKAPWLPSSSPPSGCLMSVEWRLAVR